MSEVNMTNALTSFFFGMLQEISGLHNCLHLEKLFLYDNNIHQITNLEMLVNLCVLWLNKNQISDIKVDYVYIWRYCKCAAIATPVFYTFFFSQGLDSLVNLEELNLADNAIETLGR